MPAAKSHKVYLDNNNGASKRNGRIVSNLSIAFPGSALFFTSSDFCPQEAALLGR
jgi:hypothetical protein